MMPLIDELKAVPGVIGACIFDLEQGLRVSNLPTIFNPERLSGIAASLERLFESGQSGFADLTDITLNFDESVLLSRRLSGDNLLIAVCDPGCNLNLLHMSFNLLEEEYQSAYSGASPAAVHPEAAEPPPEAAGDPRLPALLEDLQGALAQVLGPMAGFLFDEARAAWTAREPAAFTRIDELLDTLDREIDDPRKSEEYRNLVVPLLEDFRKG